MNRDKLVKFRVSNDELIAMQKRCVQAELTLSEFCRRAALGAKVNNGLRANAVRQMARIENSLFHVARWANENVSPIHAVEVVAVLMAIQRDLTRTLY